MKIDPKLDKEIEDLKSKLQDCEDIDPIYMDEETKEIRHKIFHIHERTEILLEIFLANHLLIAIDNSSVTTEERFEFKQRFNQIIANTDFSKKVKSVEEAGLLNGSLIGKLYKLNDLRKIFAHPSAYTDKISEYKDNPEKELETLKLLEDVYESLNEIYAKRMGISKEGLKLMAVKSKEDLDKIANAFDKPKEKI